MRLRQTAAPEIALPRTSASPSAQIAEEAASESVAADQRQPLLQRPWLRAGVFLATVAAVALVTLPVTTGKNVAEWTRPENRALVAAEARLAAARALVASGQYERAMDEIEAIQEASVGDVEVPWRWSLWGGEHFTSANSIPVYADTGPLLNQLFRRFLSPWQPELAYRTLCLRGGSLHEAAFLQTALLPQNQVSTFRWLAQHPDGDNRLRVLYRRWALAAPADFARALHAAPNPVALESALTPLLAERRFDEADALIDAFSEASVRQRWQASVRLLRDGSH